MSKLTENEEDLATCLAVPITLALVFGALYGATWATVFFVEGVGIRESLPFWPTFVGWVLVFVLLRWLKGGRKE